MQERIQKIIRDALGMSRRAAEDVIIQGVVTVNGVSAKIGDKADRDIDKIVVRGQLLSIPDVNILKVYYVLHKPVGYTSTREDRFARRVVGDLIPQGNNLFIAGRLDKNSEGLMVLTNDGDLVNTITHPSFQMEKKYYVSVDRYLSTSEMRKMEEGIKLDGELYKVKSIKNIRSKRYEYEVVLTEGKKREIRILFDVFNIPVLRLVRLAIGPIELGNLPSGKFRKLTNEEVYSLVHYEKQE